jgi:hypothetical protein
MGLEPKTELNMPNESEGRHIIASAQGIATALGSVIVTLKEGHTGRTVTAADEYVRAEAWAKQETQEELLSHGGYREFQGLLLGVQILGGPALPCFRGRRELGFNAKAPACGEMGPPPGGRYDGPRSLYLCRSDYGVNRELKEREGPLYIQRYCIPTDQLRLADFVQLEERSFINAVFKFCEDANLLKRANPTTLHAYYKSYLFSQTVARLVREAGFDGMVVRGVHGENVQDEQGQWCPKHYSNVVVFNPIQWEKWLEPGAQPYRAPVPESLLSGEN